MVRVEARRLGQRDRGPLGEHERGETETGGEKKACEQAEEMRAGRVHGILCL